MFYIFAKLTNLHKNVLHFSLETFFILLKFARPQNAIKKRQNVLRAISRRCYACQKNFKRIVCFWVAQFVENSPACKDKQSTDIIFSDSGSVLTTVDSATKFSAATFSDDSEARNPQSVNKNRLYCNDSVFKELCSSRIACSPRFYVYLKPVGKTDRFKQISAQSFWYRGRVLF